MSNATQLWIGLVDLAPGEPRPDGIEEDIGGAFTHFVCLAPNASGFRAAAANYFRSEGWLLVDVEDVEPVAKRLAAGGAAGDVMDAIDRVRRTGQPSAAESWDRYPVEDEK